MSSSTTPPNNPTSTTEKKTYDGRWARQFTPIDVLIEKLEQRQHVQKAWHHFYRNLFVFLLVLVYSLKTLDPSIRRGLIDSSLETFINVPFDVDSERRISSFHHIHTEEEFFAWARAVLHPAIFNPTFSYDRFNRVLWGLRFRQIRMKDQTIMGGCDNNRLPPLLAQANLTGMACKYNYGDHANILEEDFGHPSTRLEQNSRGLPVNTTSEEWIWKPSTYDEGIIMLPSRLHPEHEYDQAGYFVDIPLNATYALDKLNAMQYGRYENGDIITSAAASRRHAEQSAKTKFLSDQTVVVVVTVQAFNSGSGFLAHNQFVMERSIVGDVQTYYEILAGKLGSECIDPWSAFGDVVGVVLGLTTIVYSLLVINDFRSGGHHMTAMLVVDVLNTALLYIHVWWQSRKLVFGVDQTRFLDAVQNTIATTAAGTTIISSNININNNNNNIAINDVSKLIDLQYYLSWDQTALMVLGINVILFSIRLFGSLDIHPV
jgi:hypothetical protein